MLNAPTLSLSLPAPPIREIFFWILAVARASAFTNPLAPMVSMSSPAPRSTVILLLYTLDAIVVRFRVASSSPAPREIVESFRI